MPHWQISNPRLEEQAMAREISWSRSGQPPFDIWRLGVRHHGNMCRLGRALQWISISTLQFQPAMLLVSMQHGHYPMERLLRCGIVSSSVILPASRWIAKPEAECASDLDHSWCFGVHSVLGFAAWDRSRADFARLCQCHHGPRGRSTHWRDTRGKVAHRVGQHSEEIQGPRNRERPRIFDIVDGNESKGDSYHLSPTTRKRE